MSDFNWNDYDVVDEPTSEASTKESDFDWNAYETVAPEISELESGGRGLLQGLTFGFADELSGVGEALWNMSKGDPATFKELYKKYRDESRTNFSDSQKANPLSYGAGELGGGIATMLVPGLGAAKGVQALSKLAVRGAAEGAAYGLGASEAEDVGGMVADTALGGTIGAAMPYAIGGVGKGARAMKNAIPESISSLPGKAASIVKNEISSNPVQKLSKFALNMGLDLPEGMSDVIIKYGKGFKDSKLIEEVGEMSSATVKNLDKKVNELDTIAWKKLDKKDKFGTQNAVNMLDQVLLDHGVYETKGEGDLAKILHPKTSELKKALSKYQEIRESITDYGEKISEYDLKHVIRKVDKELRGQWNKDNTSEASKVLKDVRYKLNESLSHHNPAYGKDMDNLSTMINLRDESRVDLGLDLNFNRTDRTAQKLMGLTKADGKTRLDLKKSRLDQLNEYRPDLDQNQLTLTEEALLAKIDSTTNTGAPMGTTNPFVGAVIGSAGGFGFGGPLGGVAGGLAGLARNKYGRGMAKGILNHGGTKAIKGADQFLAKLPELLPSLPAKYQRQLGPALQRGGNALAVTHFLLSQRDPEYRKLYSDEDED